MSRREVAARLLFFENQNAELIDAGGVGDELVFDGMNGIDRIGRTTDFDAMDCQVEWRMIRVDNHDVGARRERLEFKFKLPSQRRKAEANSLGEVRLEARRLRLEGWTSLIEPRRSGASYRDGIQPFQPFSHWFRGVEFRQSLHQQSDGLADVALSRSDDGQALGRYLSACHEHRK